MTEHGSDFRFDPASNFYEFLDEARHHRREEANPRAPLPSQGFTDTERSGTQQQKSKKSWKNSLLSWLPKACKKLEKKSNSTAVEPAKSSHRSNYGRRHVSGPAVFSRSEPLAGLFRSSRGLESEIPYTSLSHWDEPQSRKVYGPVYYVT